MKYLTLLLFLTTGILNAQLIEKDKQLHALGGAAFAVPGYMLGMELSNGNRTTGYLVGIGIGTGVNGLKETTDIGKTGFDFNDVFAGFIGSVISTTATDLITHRGGRKWKGRELRKLEAMKKADLKYKNKNLIE